MKRLKEIIVRETFFPRFLGLFVNPFYFSRRGLHLAMKELSPLLTGRVLDVGCGTKPYKSLFSKADEYVGLEIDSKESRERSSAEYFYDGKIFPFESAAFDGMVLNQVFEHVFNPSDFMREVSRVLKKNGVLLLTVPFVWDEHEQPYDYARYSSFGIKYLLSQHGFEVVEQRKTAPDVGVIFQLINAYLFKITVTRSSYVNIVLCVLLMSPFNILGSILAKILPSNQDLYLDNVLIARRV